MIRVAFPAIGGTSWPAGRIYLWNLLFAVQSLSDRQLQPIVVHGADFSPSELAGIVCETHSVDGLLDRPRIKLAGRAAKYLLGRDVVIERSLRRVRADVYSHGPPLGRRSRFPQLLWIPDVQHRQLPELFGRVDRVLRDLAYREAVRGAQRVIVSSEAALRDLVELAGDEARHKTRVLRFVSQPRTTPELPIEELRARHDLPRRYYHLPNQFWKHKNHALVVEALRHAVREEPDIVVIATGSSEDYRNPGHYRQLVDRVAALGLTRAFRHLGVVPFSELVALMRESVAVINPSRFEGWSTTVEEAKSLGKRVLLSDIAVHREQAPLRAHYFPVSDERALARMLVDVWRSEDPGGDRAAARRAMEELPRRTEEFGRAYQTLVLDILLNGA